MKNAFVVAISVGCLILGTGVGIVAARSKETGPGIELVKGKPAKEAGLASLAEAETLAGSGSWELIGVGRVYYLSGDKAKGKALFERVTSAKPAQSDWYRIGAVYAEAGENAAAEECFQKALAMDAKDDTGQSEVGAWYVRIGQRAKGEDLMAQAFARNPVEVWHYVRMAEAFLGVPAGK
jgi:tetratricopeptide (TPR) repeat protein